MKKPVHATDEPGPKKIPRADRPPAEGFVVVVDGHFKSDFDTAVLNVPRRKSVARHPFDNPPICEKVLLRLCPRWEFGLQNAALPHVPIRYLKGHRLRSLADSCSVGLASFRIRCSLMKLR